MIFNSAYCLLFAVYFDNALPNSYGRSEGYFFCLKKQFWFGSVQGGKHDSKENRDHLKKFVDPSMSKSVKAEANKIIDQTWGKDDAPAVQVMGMEIFFSA